MPYIIKPFIALLMLSLLASCSCSNNAPIRDLEIPEIISTTPSLNSKNAVLNTFINVSFSEKMNAGSINTGTFKLFNESNKQVTGTVSYSGKSATFKPAFSLNKASSYTVFLSRSIKDVAGNQIISEYIWTFTTGIDSDTSPPVVKNMSPEPYSNLAALDTEILISFNKAINSSSITTTSFVVTDTHQIITGNFAVDGSRVTFIPTENLNYSTRYFITLNTEIEDLAGNTLTTLYQSDFSTIPPPDITPPLVSSVSPINQIKNIPLNTDIIVSFNEDIKPESANSFSVTITPEFSHSFAVTGENLIIEPDGLLSADTEYTITLESATSEIDSDKTAITDLAGNKLQTTFRWTFTTGDKEDGIGPTISHINPENDATNIANNNAITVTFSEPINPATLAGNIAIDNADATIDYSGNTAILRPKSLLANNTTFNVSLSKNISDLSGNLMLTDYSWQFTTGEAADREIPSVTTVFPENGTLNVPINSALVVRFSESVDPSSIHADSFIVSNDAGEPVTGIMKTIGASVTFHPLESLAFSENYTATINTQATDLADNSLATAYSWQFRTSSEADEIAPSILSTVPASSSNFAPTNRGVIVTFSETMDLATIHSANFFVMNTTGIRIPGSIHYAGNVITLMPNDDLEFSRSYIATITADISDISGNALGLVHSWSFTTSAKIDQQPPTILGTLPENNAKTLVSSGIIINFNKNMDAVSLNSANIFMHLDDNTNQSILGTLSVTDQSATFTPIDPLEYVTNYRMTVTTGVRDLARNALETDYTWSFTTSSTLEEEPPFVISVTPYNAEEKVSLTNSLSVIFSEAINCNTVNDSNFTLSLNEITTVGVVGCLDTNVTFTPTMALETESLYTATLNTSIGDMHGSVLEEIYTWQFTTTPWTQQIGSIANDVGEAVTVDNAGNIYTVGSTQGSLAELNKGQTDIFITKHSASSLLLWSKQFGTDSTDVVTDITHDSDGNLYLVGYSYGSFASNNNGSADMIILKLDTEGNVLWQKQFGVSQDDIATGIVLDNNNQLIISGYSDQGFDGHISNGAHDMVVLKLTNEGSPVWSQQFGTIEKDIANDVTIDTDDNIYITGYTEGNLSGNGKTGISDITLTKLDTNSNVLWTQQIGSILRDQAEAIQIDSSNNLYISGYVSEALEPHTHAGSADQVLLKYDNDGNFIWSRQFGTVEDDRANNLTVDTNDDIIITGYTSGDLEGTNMGNTDLTLMKLDASGTTLWTKQYGTEGSEVIFDIQHDSDNNLYLVGQSDGELDGNRNAGNNDVLIMKWNSEGTKQ